MGMHERLEAIAEIQTRFIKTLEHHGLIETHDDLRLFGHVTDLLAVVTHDREHAYRAIIHAMIHTPDWHLEGEHDKLCLFLARTSFHSSPDRIDIEEAPDKNGYYIRTGR